MIIDGTDRNRIFFPEKSLQLMLYRDVRFRGLYRRIHIGAADELEFLRGDRAATEPSLRTGDCSDCGEFLNQPALGDQTENCAEWLPLESAIEAGDDHHFTPHGRDSRGFDFKAFAMIGNPRSGWRIIHQSGESAFVRWKNTE
jgi:hypothetical protein